MYIIIYELYRSTLFFFSTQASQKKINSIACSRFPNLLLGHCPQFTSPLQSNPNYPKASRGCASPLHLEWVSLGLPILLCNVAEVPVDILGGRKTQIHQPREEPLFKRVSQRAKAAQNASRTLFEQPSRCPQSGYLPRRSRLARYCIPWYVFRLAGPPFRSGLLLVESGGGRFGATPPLV
jgi:hypothetical protein